MVLLDAKHGLDDEHQKQLLTKRSDIGGLLFPEFRGWPPLP